MVFDKTKAKRNAERYLAQGKILNAIGEYKQIVANDPKDFGTLNMLGDLHAKNADATQAVRCYTSVAEHYSKQGFAQKAIAIYNKISKLQPDSIDITAKLADLYKQKGSINEAHTHYKTVAEHYEREERKLEALEIRKQIASLDPKNTEICLKLGEAYLAEDQRDDAAEAFAEAGARLAKKSIHLEAIAAFERALELKPGDPKILTLFVQSHFACGTAAEAAARLPQLSGENSLDADVLNLLIDCQLESGAMADAERTVITLVEKDPASYPKFLDLARKYLKAEDADSAARAMAMSAEHLLLAGLVDDFHVLLDEVLTLNPEHMEGLRLRARLFAWQRDEAEMYDALAKLATVARERDSLDDERFALSQLVMIAPQQVEYADRLREINEEHGFDNDAAGDNLFDEQFMKAAKASPVPVPELETFEAVPDAAVDEVEEIADEVSSAGFAFVGEPDGSLQPSIELVDAGDERARLLREVDSISFYIDSGYLELAGKAIGELREEFGECEEIDGLVLHLKSVEESPQPETETATEPIAAAANGNGRPPSGLGIHDLRSELGLDEVEAVDDSDYDTHYHTAVAYQEMGLLDEAIKEFQEAVGLVQPNDPMRRFFHCANLLGHCFMLKSMPNLALTWYQRALEIPGLSDEEKQGIWYELASAYEADGDMENAGRYFEQVYAENINFRDVSERVRNMAVSQ